MGDMIGMLRVLFLTLAAAGVVAIVVIYLLRKRALSAGEIARWAKARPAPLQPADLERLRQWQRNMRIIALATLFYLGMMVGLTSALPEEARIVRWIAFLILPAMVIGGVVLQFSVRCPRCSMHLGLQTSLALPKTCERCGVSFHKQPNRGAA
jgi:hypothetical protein